MPDTPLPPASTWDKFPEIAVILLVALVILGAIVWAIYKILTWQDARETSWRDWMEGQENARHLSQEKRDLATRESQEKRDQMMREFWSGQNSAVIDSLRSQNSAVIESVRSLSQIVQGVANKLEEHDEVTRDAISAMKERTATRPRRS